jgi:hypothetical protein
MPFTGHKQKITVYLTYTLPIVADILLILAEHINKVNVCDKKLIWMSYHF